MDNSWFTRSALKSASGAASRLEGLWGSQWDVGLTATKLRGPGVEGAQVMVELEKQKKDQEWASTVSVRYGQG